MTDPSDTRGRHYFEYPYYALRRPPELDGGLQRHAVAIVGAGPIGLSAALELARHGVASVVIDPKDSVTEGSRAICLARHTLEGLQQLGVAYRFTAKALGWTHGTSFYRERPVYRLAMPHSEDERFLPMYNLQQQYTELYLADHARAQANIDVRWQSRVEGVTQTDAGVTLDITTPAGRYTLLADYVLACDGARSSVRDALGLRLRGDAYEGRYVIVDIHLRSSYPTERRAYFDAQANPGATVLVHRQPDDIWRIDYQLDEHDDEGAALEEGAIRRRIDAILDMLGETGNWELVWSSVYKAYTLCLDDYRHSRVFFAGDAAHLVPIFGVRGLNSGFADAMNIAWKLAWVVRGRAAPTLLDSYSPERRGATLDIFAQAARSTRFMTPPTRGYRRVRDAALGLALAHPFARRLLDPRQSQPYTYATGATITPDAPASKWRGGVVPGAALFNARLSRDDYLLDHLGVGFTLIYFAAGVAAPAEVGDFAAAYALQLITISAVRHADVLRRYVAEPGHCYLVRPDRHVAARLQEFDGAQLQRALAQALGAGNTHDG